MESDSKELITESDSLVVTSERLRCTAIKKNGQPCQAWAVKDGLCVGHQPNSLEARRKGGFHSSKKARLDAMLPGRLRPILELLEKSIEETHAGRLEAKKAQAIASLAGAVVRVLEAGILEERLLRLEEHYGGGYYA